jgi:Lar family restriction alleviation protein
MSEQKLKPCPFCGGEAVLIKGYFCWVKCDYCGAETVAETSTTEAVDAWNRRVSDADN